MKTYTLAWRNWMEIVRDPITLFFGFGFPLVLLLLLSAIQANIPVELFTPAQLTPGISVFGLSFMTLFSATILAKDRGSALLPRLYTTPLRPIHFILGYTLPILPLAIVQCVFCYLAALCLGLPWSGEIGLAVLGIVPISVLYIALGLLCGSLFTDKQVGGLCGALLTNLSAWLSGIWFDLQLVGGAFEKVANALPFVHAVEMERQLLAGNVSAMLPHLWWVVGYAIVILTAAVGAFLWQMRRG